MSVRRLHRAMECQTGPTDWADIGARILQVAAMAGAIHLGQRAPTLRDVPATGKPAGRDERLGEAAKGPPPGGPE